MLALSSGLLRTGLALKIRQIKWAMRSYLRDRAAQGQGIVASYAVAAGLYAAAGIFLIAACLVGLTALFRWIEMNYGLFQAFGAVGGQQPQTPGPAFSEPDQPIACRHQGQSRQPRSDRGSQGYRGGDPDRALGTGDKRLPQPP